MIKKRKIIIGFLGDKGVGKTIATNTLIEEGFCRVSIKDTILDLAKKLFSTEEFNSNQTKITQFMRKRGNKLHKGYWLNLSLVSAPNDKDKIVLDDFELEDLSENIVKTYQIVRPDITQKTLDKVEIIKNDKDADSFKNTIKLLAKNLSKK